MLFNYDWLGFIAINVFFPIHDETFVLLNLFFNHCSTFAVNAYSEEKFCVSKA